MKKINFLLLLIFSLQMAVAHSTQYNKTVITQLKNYNIRLHIIQNLTETDVLELNKYFNHLNNIGIDSKNIAYTIGLENKVTADNLPNNITAYTENALKTNSYQKLFNFLETTSTQYADHLTQFNESWISFWLHSKYIPANVCMAFLTFAPLLKLGIIENLIQSISTTPHGQNFIRKSIALPAALIFVKLLYTYYKKFSIIKNTYSILETLKNDDTQFKQLKKTYNEPLSYMPLLTAALSKCLSFLSFDNLP